MDKKPRRPRIGGAPYVNEGEQENSAAAENARYEKIDYNSRETQERPDADSYGYRNQNGYGYRPTGSYQQRNYREGYNRQQGGYDRQRQQGEYGNRREGGYDRQRQQGEYGNRREGGYGNRQQGGYGNRQQGGYGNRQQNGYGNRQQNGYDNRQQNGYDNRRQNGYGNRQQNGYGNRRQNGYNRYQQQGEGRPQMRFTPRPKRVEYDTPAVDPDSTMRLNKFMANAGICSRREADELITRGVITVNGQTVTELGFKVKPTDVVEFNDRTISIEKKCYILLNKPKDCVTTVDDPQGRKTVMDLIKGACDERVYPVGRLDRNTTGVLLLTNDGDLAAKLTHPQYIKKKIYQVWTDKPIAEEDMQQIADGIELDDGPIHADAVQYVSVNDRKQAGIEIHSGRNRVVRRMFEKLGYHVVKLDRVYFAGLTKKNVPRGKWRYLSQEEVNFLKQNTFE